MARTKMNKTVTRLFTKLHTGVYRLSRGRVGAKMLGGQIILLTTKGRRSGARREVPLIAGDHSDGWVVIASYGGHDEHPAWYLNLAAQPEASVRLGNTVHPVRARVTEGAERQELWAAMAEIYADYDEYQKVTDRQIPVVLLESQ